MRHPLSHNIEPTPRPPRGTCGGNRTIPVPLSDGDTLMVPCNGCGGRGVQ
jgi:hypothetical protein